MSARSPTETTWRLELQRGTARLRAGDREAARAHFARAHALAPSEPEPAFALGREEWRRGRIGEAERLLRLAHTARPGWAIGAAALARVLVERGRLDEAEAILAEGLRAHPGHPALLVVTGELLLDRDLADEAAAAFSAAGESGAERGVVEAGLARAENARGLALVAGARDHEAAFAFKRAADLDPTWAPPHVNLGALLHRLGKLQSARSQYRRALALDAGHGTAHFNLGLLERDRGDLLAATRAFTAALDAEAPHPLARRELALTLAEQGEFGRAVELFEHELRATRRPDATLYTNLGLAHARAGHVALAEAAFKQALVLDPHHRAALENLAALYHLDGRDDEAEALARAARDLGNPDDPPLSK